MDTWFVHIYPDLSFFLLTLLSNVTKKKHNRNSVKFLHYQCHISGLTDYHYFLQVCAIEIYTCIIYKIYEQIENGYYLEYMYSVSPATVKGNGTESVISARCTQPFTFPGISLGENSAHQQLISPGTHYCWVDRGNVGWEVCPTLLHLSNSAPLPALPPSTLPPLSFSSALPPWVKHIWL